MAFPKASQPSEKERVTANACSFVFISLCRSVRSCKNCFKWTQEASVMILH
jgi:hypothetical protein